MIVPTQDVRFHKGDHRFDYNTETKILEVHTLTDQWVDDTLVKVPDEWIATISPDQYVDLLRPLHIREMIRLSLAVPKAIEFAKDIKYEPEPNLWKN